MCSEHGTTWRAPASKGAPPQFHPLHLLGTSMCTLRGKLSASVHFHGVECIAFTLDVSYIHATKKLRPNMPIAYATMSAYPGRYCIFHVGRYGARWVQARGRESYIHVPILTCVIAAPLFERALPLLLFPDPNLDLPRRFCTALHRRWTPNIHPAHPLTTAPGTISHCRISCGCALYRHDVAVGCDTTPPAVDHHQGHCHPQRHRWPGTLPLARRCRSAPAA